MYTYLRNDSSFQTPSLSTRDGFDFSERREFIFEYREYKRRNRAFLLVGAAVIIVSAAVTLSIAFGGDGDNKSSGSSSSSSSHSNTITESDGDIWSLSPPTNLPQDSNNNSKNNNNIDSNSNNNNNNNNNPFDEPSDKTVGDEIPDSSYYVNDDIIPDEIPVDSSDLAYICDPDRIAQNPAYRSQCEECCSEALGCCDPTLPQTCYYSNFTYCKAHAGCSVLEDGLVPPAPSNLEDICGKGNGKLRKGCKDSCEMASCCFDRDEGRNCLNTDFLSCSNYGPCSSARFDDGAGSLLKWGFIIHQDTAPITITTPSLQNEMDLYEETEINVQQHDPTVTYLMGACSEENKSREEGRQICEDACESARCCTEPGLRSCLFEYVHECALYAPFCDFEQELNSGTLTPAPRSLANACDVTTLQGRIQCAAACEKGRCCGESRTGFEFGLGECFAQNLNSCVSYGAACYNQIPVGSTLSAATAIVPQAPDAIAQQCASNTIQTFRGWMQCKASCEIADCCFSLNRDKNCFRDNVLQCGSYLRNCHEVQSPSYEEYQQKRNKPETTVAPWSDLQDVCSPLHLQMRGTENCESLCRQERKCCDPYLLDEGSSCYLTRFEECQQFLPCTMLSLFKGEAWQDAKRPDSKNVVQGLLSREKENPALFKPPKSSKTKSLSNQSPPKDLSKICRKGYVKRKGDDECRSACERAECCFTDDECEQDCELFESCSILYSQ